MYSACHGLFGHMEYVFLSDVYGVSFIAAMSPTAEIAVFLFITLYTSNIHRIVVLCTNIWNAFDTSDIILSKIEDLFLQIMHFL